MENRLKFCVGKWLMEYEEMKLTELFLATYNDEFEKLQDLIDLGCSPNKKISYGLSSFDAAYRRQHFECINIFLRNGFKPSLEQYVFMQETESDLLIDNFSHETLILFLPKLIEISKKYIDKIIPYISSYNNVIYDLIYRPKILMSLVNAGVNPFPDPNNVDIWDEKASKICYFILSYDFSKTINMLAFDCKLFCETCFCNNFYTLKLIESNYKVEENIAYFMRTNSDPWEYIKNTKKVEIKKIILQYNLPLLYCNNIIILDEIREFGFEIPPKILHKTFKTKMIYKYSSDVIYFFIRCGMEAKNILMLLIKNNKCMLAFEWCKLCCADNTIIFHGIEKRILRHLKQLCFNWTCRFYIECADLFVIHFLKDNELNMNHYIFYKKKQQEYYKK